MLDDDVKLALIVLVGWLVFILLTGCAQPKRTRAILEAEGFTEVEVWYSEAACPDHEYSAAFKATKQGERVRGAVCRGWLERSEQIRWGRE